MKHTKLTIWCINGLFPGVITTHQLHLIIRDLAGSR